MTNIIIIYMYLKKGKMNDIPGLQPSYKQCYCSLVALCNALLEWSLWFPLIGFPVQLLPLRIIWSIFCYPSSANNSTACLHVFYLRSLARIQIPKVMILFLQLVCLYRELRRLDVLIKFQRTAENGSPFLLANSPPFSVFLLRYVIHFSLFQVLF